MIGLLKAYLNWAERIAYEDATNAGFYATRPDPDAPVTLDSLWELCKKYLWGSSFLYQPTTGNSYTSIYIDNGNRNDENNNDAMYALAIFLVIIWLFSGIAFQRGFKTAMKSIVDFGQNIVGLFAGILVATVGGTLAAVAGVPLKLIYDRPYLAYLQTGAEVGYDVGSSIGKWIGFFAAIIPGAIAGAALGIAYGLPIGALTLVVAPLQLLNSTYNAVVSSLNYISDKFQSVLQRNSIQESNTKVLALEEPNILLASNIETTNAAVAAVLLEESNHVGAAFTYISSDNTLGSKLLPVTVAADAVTNNTSLRHTF